MRVGILLLALLVSSAFAARARDVCSCEAMQELNYCPAIQSNVNEKKLIAKLLTQDLKKIASRKPLVIVARVVTGVVKLTPARIAVLKEKILNMTPK
jgi:hypothetical protein